MKYIVMHGTVSQKFLKILWYDIFCHIALPLICSLNIRGNSVLFIYLFANIRFNTHRHDSNISPFKINTCPNPKRDTSLKDYEPCRIWRGTRDRIRGASWTSPDPVPRRRRTSRCAGCAGRSILRYGCRTSDPPTWPRYTRAARTRKTKSHQQTNKQTNQKTKYSSIRS